MSATANGYRKKQIPLVILVFVCIGVAFWYGSAPVAVGAVLVACLLSFLAARMEPAKAPDEHQH